MINYFRLEINKLIAAIKTLSFRETFIFLSVTFITFVSMYYAAPSFMRRLIETDDEKLHSTMLWFTADGFLMLIIPLIIIRFVFKQKLSEYGFRMGDVKFGIATAALFLAVMIPIIWIVSGSEVFAKTYPQGGHTPRTDIFVLLYYELFVGFYMLAWEFFWRGFVLHGLKHKFGYYAVFIQLIPFVILHKGKPEIETFASIFAGLALGIQSLRAGSFIYCFIVHWSVMLFIDGLSVMRYKNSVFGIGFEDFYNIFFK